MHVKTSIRSWLLSACLAGATPALAADYNTAATLVYFDSAGNETLDPAEPQNNSSFSHETLLALYDTLIRMDQAGVPGPGLAESWTRNADLTELTLKLRKGVKFHDGTPFDAQAVKHNFDRMAALGRRASGSVVETFNLIQSVDYIGDDTVKLKLKSPNGQIEYWLGGNSGMMLSPAGTKGDAFGGTITAIGTGPYKLKKFEANVTTSMLRSDDYWGGTAGRPAGFDHHYIPDGRARLNALRSGQANIVTLDARAIPEAKGAGLAVLVIDKNAFWDIYPNLKKGPLGDVRIRRAIMHAIDREALGDALTNGSGKATQQVWSAKSPFYVKDIENRYPFDQKKARALMAEAGFKDGFELSLLLLNSSEYRLLAEALQANLGEVGIRLKFDAVDVSQFPLFFKQPPRGDILLARYGGRSDPVQSVFELVGTGGSYTPGGAASPRIDDLLSQARGMAATDPKRLTVMHDLAREVSEMVGTMPVISRANVYAAKPGCILDLDAYLPSGDDRFNDVKIAAGCK